MKKTSFILALVLTLIGSALALEPPHYARSERYSELTKLHGESFLGTADTTAAAYLSTHYCSTWLPNLVTETWIDSSTAFDTDTVFFDYRTKEYEGDSWGSWTRIDTAIAHQVRKYKAVTYTLKPWAVQLRATQKSNSASTVSTPHGRWWCY